MATSIKLEIIVDDKGTPTVKKFGEESTAALKKTQKAGEDLGSGFAKTWAGMAAGAAGAVYVFEKVSAVAGDMISSYMASESATLKLGMAMKNQGDFTREALAVFEEYAAMLQRTTTVEDDLAISVMGNLKAYGMTNEEVKAATKIAADFAAAKKAEGMTIETAADLLGKAYAGNTVALGRYGIVLNDSIPAGEKFAAVMDQLNARFGGSAQAELLTYEGQWKQIKNAFGDVQEMIGLGLLKTIEALGFGISMVGAGFWTVVETILKGVGFVTENLQKLGKFVGFDTYASAMGGFSDALHAGAQNAKEAAAAAIENADKNYKMMTSFDRVTDSIAAMGVQGKRTKVDLEDSSAAIAAAAKSNYELQEKLAKSFYQERADDIKTAEQLMKISGAAESEIMRTSIESRKNFLDEYYQKEKALIRIGAEARSADDRKKLSDAQYIADKLKGLEDDVLQKRKAIANDEKILDATVAAERREQAEKTAQALIKAEDDWIKEIADGAAKSLETVKKTSEERARAERDLYKDLRGYEQSNYDATIALIAEQAKRYQDLGVDKVAIEAWVAQESENAYIKMSKSVGDWKLGVLGALTEVTTAHTTWGSAAYATTKTFADDASKAFGSNFRDVINGDFTNLGTAWGTVWTNALTTFTDTLGKMIVEAAAKDIALMFDAKWTVDGSAVIGMLSQLGSWIGSMFGGSGAGSVDSGVGSWAANAGGYGGHAGGGALGATGSPEWVGERGRELVFRTGSGFYVLPHEQSMAYAAMNGGYMPGHADGGFIGGPPDYGSFVGNNQRIFQDLLARARAGEELSYIEAYFLGQDQGQHFPWAPDNEFQKALLMMWAATGTPDLDVARVDYLGDNHKRIHHWDGYSEDSAIDTGGLSIAEQIFTGAIQAAIIAAAREGGPAVSAFFSFAMSQMGNSTVNWSSGAMAALAGAAAGYGATGTGENILPNLGKTMLSNAGKIGLGHLLGGGTGRPEFSLSGSGSDNGLGEMFGSTLSGIAPKQIPFAFPARNGIDYVPNDDFLILGHNAEAMLPADEAAAYRAGKYAGGSASPSEARILQPIVLQVEGRTIAEVMLDYSKDGNPVVHQRGIKYQ
ncbi:MAG: hypothetical protein ACYC7J_18340 [Syntrophales bacterium]